MLVSGNLSRLPMPRNFTPNLRQVPSGLTLAGDALKTPVEGSMSEIEILRQLTLNRFAMGGPTW